MKKTTKQQKKNIWLTVGRYIIPILFSAVIITSVVFISKYPSDMQKLFIEANKSSLEESLNVAIGTTNISIEGRKEDADLMAKNLVPLLDSTGAVDSYVTYLMTSLQQTNDYINIGLCKLSGSVYNFATMSDGQTKKIDSWVTTKTIYNNETDFNISTSPFSVSTTDSLIIRKRFKSTDGTDYLLILERNIDQLVEDLQLGAVSEDCATILITRSGSIIHQYGKFEEISYSFLDYIKTYIGEKQVDNLALYFEYTNARGNFSAEINGVNYFFIYENIENTNWLCIKGIPEESLIGDTLAKVNEETTNMVTGVAGIVIVSLFFIGYYVIKKMRETSGKNIEERESLFRAMSDHMPSAYLMITAGDRKPYFVSGNFRKVTHVPEDFEYDQEHVVSWIGKNEEILNNINGVDKFEFEITKDRFVYSIGIYNIGSLDDREFLVIVINDITREKQTKQLLQNNAENAERASIAKTEFLSRMSHEIRTPLNAILGFTTLALKNFESEDREKLKDYIQKVDSSGHYLVNLVSDVLDVSRIEAGKVELKVSDNNILDIVYDVATTFEGQMKDKGLNFVVTKNIDSGFYVSVDKEHIIQVLNNLISNAYKFTNEGGEIIFDTSITQKDNKAFIKFVVEDNGVGMSEEFIQHIFDPFTQEYNKNVKGNCRGSGLGMSICKSLIDLMNGKISVSSKYGYGTKFEIFLTLPIVNVEIKETEKEECDLSILKGKKILLVEDNELNREVVRFTFEEYGLVFDEAENGQIGVEKFMESNVNEYYALFVDLRMPIMDGYEATKCIRSLNRPDAKTVPIFAMTADASPDDINKTYISGMNCHITKPINPDKVIEQLMKL